jgi:hypothetical protein
MHSLSKKLALTAKARQTVSGHLITEDCRLLDTKIATKSAHARTLVGIFISNFAHALISSAIFVSSNLQSSVVQGCACSF